METTFRKLSRFTENALKESFREDLEETSGAFGVAHLISSRWERMNKIKFILLTNQVLSSRIDGIPGGEIQGVPVAYSVWDLSRLQRFATSRAEREEIIINVEDQFGSSIPALPAYLTTASYESYLCVLPGKLLADIYDRWGVRLLEQNVRVFLQARTKVNRGIRDTLRDTSEMFFAYNNGITATAEQVEARQGSNGLEITKLKNLQIVNGGQTTASIYNASLVKDIDLSNVFVQMKLSIVDPEISNEIVPKISQFANTQNAVNAADFFSNHPYHIRMENFSRRIYTPEREGEVRSYKWFYERARGQYLDARSNRTPAERSRFDLEYPKNRKFAKTDLAKFLNVWEEKPDTVSKGAQKNFADFAKFISDSWERKSDQFNELHYKEAVAKAVIFKEVEKMVSAADWYQGGYRANIVAYTISKLAHDVRSSGTSVDFSRIWNLQELPNGLTDALTVGSKEIHDVIVDPPSTVRNVTEWAKQAECWRRIKALNITWPGTLQRDLMTRDERKDSERVAVKEQRELNTAEAQIAVVMAGNFFWQEVLDWANENHMLSGSERGSVQKAADGGLLSDRQSVAAVRAFEKLQREGCQLELPSSTTIA